MRSSRFQRFVSSRRRAFVLDFDGTLSEIVARPELARPVGGAIRALSGLAATEALVAVVSGRPTSQLRTLVPVTGVTLVGLYGLPEQGPERGRLESSRADVEAVAALAPGAWVEDKGPSLAVHYRQASDPAEARRVLEPALRRVASEHGLPLLAGKMVLEVAGGEIPGKGSVVAGLVRDARVTSCLYAGDDTADLDAFDALDAMDDVASVKVAVRSVEAPERLLAAADLTVDGPPGLVRLLSDVPPAGPQRGTRPRSRS